MFILKPNVLTIGFKVYNNIKIVKGAYNLIELKKGLKKQAVEIVNKEEMAKEQSTYVPCGWTVVNGMC